MSDRTKKVRLELSFRSVNCTHSFEQRLHGKTIPSLAFSTSGEAVDCLKIED